METNMRVISGFLENADLIIKPSLGRFTTMTAPFHQWIEMLCYCAASHPLQTAETRLTNLCRWVSLTLSARLSKPLVSVGL